MRLNPEVADHLPSSLRASRVTHAVLLRGPQTVFGEACLLIHGETPLLLVRNAANEEFDAFELDAADPLELVETPELRLIARTRQGDRHPLRLDVSQLDDVKALQAALPAVAPADDAADAADDGMAEQEGDQTEVVDEESAAADEFADATSASVDSDGGGQPEESATDSPAVETDNQGEPSIFGALLDRAREQGQREIVTILQTLAGGEAALAFFAFHEVREDASALDGEVSELLAQALLDAQDAPLAIPASLAAGQPELVARAFRLRAKQGLDEARAAEAYGERAVVYLRRHLARHPETAHLRERLGSHLLDLGEFAAAEIELRRACELDGESMTARYLWARSLREVDEPDASHQQLQLLAERYAPHPNDSFVLCEAAVLAAWRARDDRRAGELLAARAELGLDGAEAVALQELSELAELLAAESPSIAALCALAWCEQVVLQDELAEVLAERLVAIEPLVAAALYQRTERGDAQVHHLAPDVPVGDIETLALERIEAKLEADAAAPRYQALLAFARGELEEAVAAARLACGEAPTLRELRLLARMLDEHLTIERRAVPELPVSTELLETVASGLEFAPAHPELLQLQASHHPDASQALAAADQLLTNDPLDEEALVARLDALRRLQRWEELIELLAYLDALDMGDAAVLDRARASLSTPAPVLAAGPKSWRRWLLLGLGLLALAALLLLR